MRKVRALGERDDLQKLVLERAKDMEEVGSSYVDDYWTEAYMDQRESIVHSSNPILVVDHNNVTTKLAERYGISISPPPPKKKKRNPFFIYPFFVSCRYADHGPTAGVAGALSASFARWFVALCNGQVPLETIKGTPLCMNQYLWLLGTTRIPAEGTDYRFTTHRSTHAAVLVGGLYYKVEVIRDGQALGAEEIAASLRAVMQDAAVRLADREQSKTDLDVGVMTAWDRNLWAQARKDILSSSFENARSLHDVETAIFVIALDPSARIDPSRETSKEFSRFFLDNSAKNRYFDKSIQLIVDGGGRAGVNFEHSWGDGAAVVTFLEIVSKDALDVSAGKTKINDSENGRPASGRKMTDSKQKISEQISEQSRQNITEEASDHQGQNPHSDDGHGIVVVRGGASTWKRLKFTTNPHLSHQENLAKNYAQKTLTSETTVLDFPHFGKNYLKSQKISPDSFVQSSFQLTYFDTRSRNSPDFVSVYESCNTRYFRRGRTEAIRPLSMESKKFVLSIAKNEENWPILLRKASGKHVILCEKARNGLGIDRHLFSLSKISKEYRLNIPDLFLDELFYFPIRSKISTSPLASYYLSHFGFGPVVRDGYGLAYGIHDDKIQVSAYFYYFFLIFFESVMRERERERERGDDLSHFGFWSCGERWLRIGLWHS